MILGRGRKDAGLKPEEEEEEEEEEERAARCAARIKRGEIGGRHVPDCLPSLLPATDHGRLVGMGNGDWLGAKGRSAVVHRLTKVSSFPGGNAEEETLRRRHWM